MCIEILKSKLDYIIELMKELNEDLKEYRRNEGRLPEDEEKLQKLNNEIERFCMNISQNSWRCKNRDLKDKMKEIRFDVRRIQNIRNPQLLEKEFEDFKIQWKKFLKETIDIRKGLVTENKVNAEEVQKIKLEERIIDPESEE